MASLERTPFAQLLLSLHRDGFDGWLVLERGRLGRRFRFEKGTPVRVESNQRADSLRALLEKRGSLREPARERLEKALARGGDELALLARQKSIPARALLLALRDQVTACLIDCCAWSDGRFSLEPLEAATESPALPLDPVPVVVEGIARHWRPDRTLTSLGKRVGLHPRPGPGFEALRKRLPRDPVVTALLEEMDGSRNAFLLLRAAQGPRAYGALLALDAMGALDWSDAPTSAETCEAAEDAPGGPHIEIVVAESAGGGSAEGDAGPRAADGPTRAAAEDAKLETLRREVLDLHGQLPELDCYALLGVERNAVAGTIKRAYLKLAKRLHPDALVRQGLEDVKAEANEVFAEVTRAHEVLSDPEARSNYDAMLDGHASIDADRLAQAEALYRKAELLMRSGSFGAAEELLESAVRLWPDEGEYQAALGWTLFKRNPPDLEAARARLQKAIALDETGAQSHLRLHYVLKSLGDGPGAAAAQKRARELDPEVKP